MIHIVATVTLKPGQKSTFITACQEMAVHVRQEPGNLNYDIFVDSLPTIPGQQTLPADCVVMIEQWDSTAAQQKHWNSPYMQAHANKVLTMVEHIEQRVLQAAPA